MCFPILVHSDHRIVPVFQRLVQVPVDPGLHRLDHVVIDKKLPLRADFHRFVRGRFHDRRNETNGQNEISNPVSHDDFTPLVADTNFTTGRTPPYTDAHVRRIQTGVSPASAFVAIPEPSSMAGLLRSRRHHRFGQHRQRGDLLPSRTGSVFGYRILWVLLLIALLKWVLVYTSMRHMILTGGHPCRRWSSIPGPPGWMNLFMVAVAVVCSPLWLCFLEGVLGTICTWIFGVGSLHAWASLWVAVALLLLAVGRYRFLEKAQMAILGITVSCILVAVFHVRPDWWQVMQGFLVPVALTYPEWLARELPEMAARSPWLEIMVYAAALGGQSYDYLAYVSFLREKKWGHSDGGPVAPDGWTAWRPTPMIRRVSGFGQRSSIPWSASP